MARPSCSHEATTPRPCIHSPGPLVTAFALISTRVCAQATGGTIEGRVLNTRNGEYLEKARVTIEGTQLETFTDSSGQYRFVNVPPGEARVKVFQTPSSASVKTSVHCGLSV